MLRTTRLNSVGIRPASLHSAADRRTASRSRRSPKVPAWRPISGGGTGTSRLGIAPPTMAPDGGLRTRSERNATRLPRCRAGTRSWRRRSRRCRLDHQPSLTTPHSWAAKSSPRGSSCRSQAARVSTRVRMPRPVRPSWRAQPRGDRLAGSCTQGCRQAGHADACRPLMKRSRSPRGAVRGRASTG